MRILFFVQFFYPSTEIGAKRPSEMAKHFIANGHHVDVLCGDPGSNWRPDQKVAFESSTITEIRVPPDLLSESWRLIKKLRSRSASSNSTFKPADQGSAVAHSPRTTPTWRRWFFSMEALYCGLKLWMLRALQPAVSQLRRNRYDIVINSCPPMSTALVLWWVKSFAKHRFRWVIDLRDPFITPSGPSNSSRVRSWLEDWAERVCLRSCDLVLVSTPGLRTQVVARVSATQQKIHVIYNGYEGEPSLSEVPANSEANTLKLLSAGTIYFGRDPRPLLDAMKLAITRNRLPPDAFHLTLLGNCENPTREQLSELIEQRGLTSSVELRRAVPPHEVGHFIRNAHVLVNFAQKQHALIPAKTYEYMASGKETLTITEPDSETARVVRQTGAGPIAMPDVEPLADILIDLYRRYIERREPFSPNFAAITEFSRSHQNQRALELISSLVAAR